MLFTLTMNAKEMDQKFQEGLDLWNEGKSQEGADIWMELSEHGHLVSISELFYIFLDQNEFDAAQSYIDCSKDQNDPTILFLKARLIEERDGMGAAVESFKIAADAGHPGSLSLLFDWAIRDENLTDAEFFYEKLKSHKDFLTKLSQPVTLEDLEQELNELRSSLENDNEEIDTDKLSEIYPVYFALASGDWMRTRNEINERHENEEVWESFLDEHGLTPEEFDRYEQWWVTPAGLNVVNSLSGQFMDSIYEAASVSSFKVLEDFFKEHAIWDDFIRELSDCTPADAEPNGADPSYFAEYAIGGGLCYSDWDDPEFDKELITEIFESWLRNSYEESRRILLSAYDEIKKIL